MASNKPFKRSVQILEVDNYRELPLVGSTAEIYYVRDWNKLAVWDDNKEDWKLISRKEHYESRGRSYTKAVSKSVYDIDDHNDRRGAIMAQRERGKRGS